MIRTTGKEKNYELVEYVNDVNREHTEVLMELNINGIMDTAYSYGDQRLTNERFTEWTGYYTYDPRGSVTGVTDEEGMIWQSYRYDAFGSLTFGQPQYNNVYSYNSESYNPNIDAQYLRARYYSPTSADFISEDSYLGKLTDPLSLNRYNYVKSSPLNYVDPSGHEPVYNYVTGEYEDNHYEDLPNDREVGGMGDDWNAWAEQYAGALNQEQRTELHDIMKQATKEGKYSLCEAAIEVRDTTFNAILSMLIGAMTLDKDYGGIWSNPFTNVVLYSMVENETAFYIGRTLQSAVGVLLGFLVELLGAAIAVGETLGTAVTFRSGGGTKAVAMSASGSISIIAGGTAVYIVGEQIIIEAMEGVKTSWDKAQKADEDSKNSDKGDSEPELTSSIDKDPRLVKAAEEMGKNERVQQEADHLIDELLKGNENPGLGSKNLFKDVSYLRGRNGARVFYRKTATGYEILGKADKANEQTVINILKKLYE